MRGISGHHYFFVGLVPIAQPLSAVDGKCTLVGQQETAIQSNPIHDFRINEIQLALAQPIPLRTRTASGMGLRQFTGTTPLSEPRHELA
jgi:hypothetical protein